eukprot:2203566-Pleurochrysis_carterae.AAC.1
MTAALSPRMNKSHTIFGHDTSKSQISDPVCCVMAVTPRFDLVKSRAPAITEAISGAMIRTYACGVQYLSQKTRSHL